MKKLVSVMVSLAVLFSFALAGCGDVEPYKQKIADLEQKIEELENASGTHEEEFEEVYSITYGDEKTVTSSVKVTFGEFIETSKEEFDQRPPNPYTNLNRGRKKLEIEEGDYFKSSHVSYIKDGERIDAGYGKQKVEKITYDYVCINFLSEKACLIKTNNSTIKVVSDYFKVVYFTD